MGTRTHRRLESGTDPGMTPDTVVIVTGNVATDIARMLASCGRLAAVAARSVDKAQKIAGAYPGVKAVGLYNTTLPDAKFYICAVTDPAILHIAENIPDNGAVWIHTAGSVGIEIWAGHRSRYGVLYPLQTISSLRPVDSSRIPWLIEADSSVTLQLIDSLANSIGGWCVSPKNSSERALLHVAAVFACNFTNYILGEAFEFLEDRNIDPSILKPLVERTVENAFSGKSPHLLQTGPAVRGNKAVIESHINRLPADSAETYRFLSDKIYRKHHPSEK